MKSYAPVLSLAMVAFNAREAGAYLTPSIPPTTMALYPHSYVLPPVSATPANNFWTLYTQFCAILCVFSVNFGSCLSRIMTQKTQKYKWSWQSTLHAFISKWRIKRNRASAAREKIFEKMIGILYKANILIIKFVHKIHILVC